MQSSLKLLNKNVTLIKGPTRILTHPYSSKRVCELKTIASQKYAPDSTGQHKVQMNTFCQDKACEKKDCNTPCEEIKEAEITGNYTHASKIKNNPNINKVVKVKDTDFDGNKKPQYFAKLSKRTKLSKKELEDFTENDIEVDKKATKICNLDPNILKEVT